MGVKEWDSCIQVHISDGIRSDDGDKQVVSNSIINYLIDSLGMNKFQC